MNLSQCIICAFNLCSAGVDNRHTYTHVCMVTMVTGGTHGDTECANAWLDNLT